MASLIKELQERLTTLRAEEKELKEKLRATRVLIDSCEALLFDAGASSQDIKSARHNKTVQLLSVIKPKESLSPSEIFDRIVEIDSTFSSDYVYSILSRLKRQKRIVELDGKYSLPKTK